MTFLLLMATLLILVWQLVKVKDQQQQLQRIQSLQLPSDYQIYADLGQSIAALHIQLQAAQKLWNIDPTQAQTSLLEASQLSSALMQEVRFTVKQLSSSSFRGNSDDAPENSAASR